MNAQHAATTLPNLRLINDDSIESERLIRFTRGPSAIKVRIAANPAFLGIDRAQLDLLLASLSVDLIVD